jgi:3-oxoacyl-[acyl-carrier protein] reductase
MPFGDIHTERVAVVTGAARGIGAAIAARLARDGFAVMINYAESAAPAEELARKVKTSGGLAAVCKADVSKPEDVRRLFAETIGAFGGIDVLVNNAGVMSLANIVDVDDAAFDRMIDINLKGSFNTMREAAKLIRPGGRIINFSTSIVGTLLPTYAVYAATKAGVEAMTAILAKELRGRNVTVNAIAPGPTATDMFLTGKSPELIDRMSKMAPLERLASPDDIAAAVSFLAGPDGGWINGQTIRANGGLV